MPGRMNTKKTKEKNSFKRKERSLLKKCLTGPTLLEISGKRGSLNGSTQHLLGTHAQGFQQLKVVRERRFKRNTILARCD
jgi:hypothetical protein